MLDQKEQIFLEDYLIILTKPMLDIFLKEDNPDDLIALYTFYYYVAKWQGTNQIKATNKYVMNGLHWGEKKFDAAKKKLIKFDLIRPIVKHINGKTQWFVKLNFIIKADTINGVYIQKHPGAFKGSNALSNNNLSKDKLTGEDTSLSNSKKKEKKKINFTPNKKEIALMRFWNSLTGVPKHLKPETNIYIQSCKVMRMLFEGKYFSHYKVSEDFKEKNKIDTMMLKKKYDYEQIEKYLKRVSLYYQEGYWPLDKKGLPKQLPDIFFNPRTRRSFFFMAVAKKPIPNDSFVFSRPKDRELYKEYQRLFQDLLVSGKEEENLIIKFNAVYNFFESKCKIIFRNDKYWLSYFKTPAPIMKEHVRWLAKKKELYIGYIDVQAQTFTNFLVYLKTLRKGQWDFTAGRKIPKEKESSLTNDFKHLSDIVY
jgi:hypothetical protein